MADKYLINSVDECVDECLYGFSKLYPHLECYFSEKIVFDAESCGTQKISVISGGGSGHEPFPAGYVGAGMLTASVSGSIFTSPPSSHILQCIRLAAEKSAGILLVVPNYTGDVLNFGLAAEIASTEGIQVETVIVGEDVAQDVHQTTSKAGRRGMCGLVFIFKMAGHLSRSGKHLSEITQICKEALTSMASLGMCVSSCGKPGVGLLFNLNPDEAELGVGVHGEAGVARLKLMPANEAVKILLDHISRRLKLQKGNEVVVAVNNLGALTHIEQWLLAGEVQKQLEEQGIHVLRLYAGSFFTSLNMSGLQICVLKLNTNTRDVILEALDSSTDAPAWPKEVKKKTCIQKILPKFSKNIPDGLVISSEESMVLKRCLRKAAEKLTEVTDQLNRLDTACGDGDCGSTFARIAREILAKTNNKDLDFSKSAGVFYQLSLSMQESIGGTSGALYGLFFKGISDELNTSCKDKNMYARCWRSGIERIKKYSSARRGDRTMLDPLESACEVFEESLREKSLSLTEAFEMAVKAAGIACENTKTMKASAGRASYTNPSQQTEVDAGAYAVTVWLSAVLQEIRS